MRIGLPLPHCASFCMCCRALDHHGVHLLTCKHFRQLSTLKHDHVIHVLQRLAIDSGSGADTHNLTEFRQLDPSNGKRPDLRIRGLGEKNILVDATFGDPRCSTHVQHASVTQGYAIHKLEESKMRKYDHHCREIGATFHAAAFEIFGSTSAETEDLIEKLVKRAAERRHIDYPILLSYWRKPSRQQSNWGMPSIYSEPTPKFYIELTGNGSQHLKNSFRML